MAFKDFSQQELGHSDTVVMVAGKYVELRRGVIVSFTKQKVRVLTQQSYGLTGYDEILIYPYQCVKLDSDETRSASGPWAALRAAAQDR